MVYFTRKKKKNGNLHKDQKESQRLRHVTVDWSLPHSCGNRMHSPCWVGSVPSNAGHRHRHHMKLSSLLSCSPSVKATPSNVIRKPIQNALLEWHQNELWFEKRKYRVKGRVGAENLNSCDWDLLMCHWRTLLHIVQLGSLLCEIGKSPYYLPFLCVLRRNTIIICDHLFSVTRGSTNKMT